MTYDDLSDACGTVCGMPSVTIRTDTAVERALDFLVAEHDGLTRSDVVRAAILELERSHRRASLRAESAALAADPDERAAAAATAQAMADLSAW